MAFPTAVNDQVTDAITQANLSTLGNSPAMALGALFQVHAHSVGILMENAVAQQQNASILANAVISRCVSGLMPTQ